MDDQASSQEKLDAPASDQEGECLVITKQPQKSNSTKSSNSPRRGYKCCPFVCCCICLDCSGVPDVKDEKPVGVKDSVSMTSNDVNDFIEEELKKLSEESIKVEK